MEEGDLQAVVKGCTNFDPNWFTTTTTTKQEDVDFDFIYSSSFTDLLETSRVLDELEELYKPFYPNTILSSSSSSVSDHDFNKRPTDAEKLKRDEKPVFIGSSTPVSAASTSSHHHHEIKYKRRKNQLKKVVHQVAAEGVPSDTWAWRKYGQKPIKGSPYPRSYYRCSSLKGCLARKLVERSPSNPELLVITYTADHCHPRPTKKSCLAGTTRQKFSTVSRTAAAATTTMTSSPISPAASTTLSPPLTSSATMEDSELSPLGFNNGRANGGEEDQLMYDLRLEGGFFNGLDDLRNDLCYSSCVSQQDQYPMFYPTCW